MKTALFAKMAEKPVTTTKSPFVALNMELEMCIVIKRGTNGPNGSITTIPKDTSQLVTGKRAPLTLSGMFAQIP